MISKMEPPPKDGGEGSRIGIVFNGSPLFTGDAGSGESNIRRWIIENDMLEAVIGLPDQLFYNTGISTYVWIVTNRKRSTRAGKVQLINGTDFAWKMKKSLGDKRKRIGDGTEGTPNHIEVLAKLYGDFAHDVRLSVGQIQTNVDPKRDQTKGLFVSKIFDNEDFGYHKITVERPLKLNFQASAERIVRLDEDSGFKKLATSAKKDPAIRQQEIAAGHIRELLQAFGKATAEKLFKERKAFLAELRAQDRKRDVRLSAPELKVVLAALGERDETADICRDRDGQAEPDADLRDTETVPLKESIDAYFKREVEPHVPDAWIDTAKTKVGYEIPLNRHFYRYEPPRPLEVIETDIKRLEDEILKMLKEVTA